LAGWLAREMQRAEQRSLDAMRPKPKTTWRIPADLPCSDCIQEPGSSVCKTQCPFWPELLRMRYAGELERRDE